MFMLIVDKGNQLSNNWVSAITSVFLKSYSVFISFTDETAPAQNNCTPTPTDNCTNHIPVKAEVVPGPAAAASNPNRTLTPLANHVLNGDVPHARPRLPGGFPVRESTISITASDGYYSGGGLQSTQKGKYRNRDMKNELQDIIVEMDRITLGELLEEGELRFG